MHAVIPLLLRHGYWVLVVNVFAEQVGLPIPAFPVLLAMGALAGMGEFSIWAAFFLAISAALASDVICSRSRCGCCAHVRTHPNAAHKVSSGGHYRRGPVGRNVSRLGLHFPQST